MLGWAASVHSGKQDDIAERIGRHSDILVHLSDEGFTGLIPQAILEFDGGERLFLGRVENRRNAYLMYCRTAGFSTVVQVSLDETRQELVAGHVRLFNGDADLAGEWAERLADRLRRGELRPAPASEGDSHGSGRERLHWWQISRPGGSCRVSETSHEAQAGECPLRQSRKPASPRRLRKRIACSSRSSVSASAPSN